jgi:hypothetical protein
MRLTEGSFRELRWHTADEWAIMQLHQFGIGCCRPPVDSIGEKGDRHAK